MRIGKIEKAPTHSRRPGEAVILFVVASNTFAISAAAVEEIRSRDDCHPLRSRLPLGAAPVAKVRYTVERDGRTYFVVDANLHLRLLSSHPTRVLLLRDSRLALSVDSIDRMAEITALHSLPRAFRGEERNWYRGLALIGEDVVPVMNPAAFLSPAEVALLDSTIHQGGESSLAAKGAATA